MLTHEPLPSKERSHFYRCPGCSEMVDGRQLSEVLMHHQHVLDSYRLGLLRGFDAARAKATVKRRRKASGH